MRIHQAGRFVRLVVAAVVVALRRSVVSGFRFVQLASDLFLLVFCPPS
jgi:tRNA threonylcarbamoyladenosine modification (KEOPS) complex  Pcc1 subunit